MFIIGNLNLEKTKNKTNGIKRLTPYLYPYRWKLLLVLAALLLSSASILIISQSIRYMIDNGIAMRSQKTLQLATSYIFILICLLAIGTAVRSYLISVIGENVMADVRRAIYDKLLSLSPSYFETNKAAHVISVLISDTAAIYTIIKNSLSISMRNLVMMIGSIVLLFSSSYKLTLIVGCIIPIVIIPITFVSRRAKSFSKNIQHASAEIAAAAEESINNITIVQAYNNQQLATKNFEYKLQDELRIATGRLRSSAIMVSTVIILCFSAVTAVFWFGGHEVISGRMTSGQLSSFIFLVVLCAASAVGLSDVFHDICTASGIGERINDFLEIHPGIINKKNAIDINEIYPDWNGAIELKDVIFAYPSKPNKKILDGLSFSLSPGKLTAIVGQSGAGKSTIIQLLLRFFEIDHGAITCDNIDIKDVTIESLRRNFAYVSQDPHIFADTIYANIAYGRPNASIKEVEEAAAAAAALDFIHELPEGFNTFVGEKGVRLSGGQKQRISIARALLRNAKVLLLDEATSALDSYNEQKVQEGLEQLLKNRTALVIAHRLSTIIKASQIIVLHKGKVVEQGNHSELIALDGHYANLLYNSNGSITTC